MRLYIILSDVHRQRHLCPDTNRLRNARVMAHFFLRFFFFLFHFSRQPSQPRSSLTSPFLLDFASRCDSHDAPAPFKKSTYEYVSWITRFCSSLKTTSHNGSNGRTFAQHPLCPIHTLSRITLWSSPAGAKISPFQSHSTLLRFPSRLLLSLNSVHIIQYFSVRRPS